MAFSLLDLIFERLAKACDMVKRQVFQNIMSRSIQKLHRIMELTVENEYNSLKVASKTDMAYFVSMGSSSKLSVKSDGSAEAASEDYPPVLSLR